MRDLRSDLITATKLMDKFEQTARHEDNTDLIYTYGVIKACIGNQLGEVPTQTVLGEMVCGECGQPIKRQYEYCPCCGLYIRWTGLLEEDDI